jgi:hypothetical protein
MPKKSHKRQPTQRPKRKTNRGVRGERLPGDGRTFSNITAMPKSITPPQLTYRMSQSYEALSAFSSSSSLNQFLSYTFSFGAIDQSASLVNIFDQYRIREVEFWLIPRINGVLTTSYGGLLSSVIDLDDSTLLSQPNQAGDYASCVTTESTQGHYRRFKPHAAIAAYSGAFTSFANQQSPWCDTSSPSIVHYGIKLALTVHSTQVVYDINTRLHMEFRSVR